MAYLYSTQFSDSTLSSAEIFEISQAISRDYQTTLSHPLQPAQNWQQDELMAISLQISRDYAPDLHSPLSSQATLLAPTELREISRLISSRYSPEAYSPQTDKENLVLLPVDSDNLFVYGQLANGGFPVFDTARPPGYLPLCTIESMVNVNWALASRAGQQKIALPVVAVSDGTIRGGDGCKQGFGASVLSPALVRFSQPFLSWASPKVLPLPFSSSVSGRASKSFGKSASGQNNSVVR